MTDHGNQRALFSCSMFILVPIMQMLSQGYVEGRPTVVQKNTDHLKHKGTVRTIEGEDGDVIDCVDIHQQPAFDHPLIKDLQMKPSTYPNGKEIDDGSQPEIIQNWHKNGECPKGTVPIRRDLNHDLHRTKFPLHFHGRQQLNHSLDQTLQVDHEYAMTTAKGDVYHGGYASISVWNPKTEAGEFSVSQIWVASDVGGYSKLNTIEAGWIVFPGGYGDYQTRFTIYWTSDCYKSTGCYDFDCPGFVQTNRKLAIGLPIKHVSTYKGKSFDISIKIYKDNHFGNWWLQLQDQVLGYFPGSIFTSLADSATQVSWGGEIIQKRSAQHHTTTQMGNGHFPSEKIRKSSYFRNIGVYNSSDNDNQIDPSSLQNFVTNRNCYDLHVEKNAQTKFGTHFYYGGPGYSAKCP